MLARRSFLSAGAVIVGCRLPDKPSARAQTPAANSATRFNTWISIGPDDRALVRTSCTEMGQGIHTLISMLVSEELEIDPARIAIEMAPVDPAYDNPLYKAQLTGNSSSAATSFEPLRRAAAQARIMLRQAAAARWNCALEECEAAGGKVQRRGTGTALSYGALAAEAGRLAPPATVALKPRNQWRVLGKPAARLGARGKLQGTTPFGIDVRLPEMLFAAVRNCPFIDGRLASLDAAAAQAMDGVVAIVPVDGAVIAVARSTWAAFQAADALRPIWDAGADAKLDSEAIDFKLRQALDAPGKTVASRGRAGAEKTLTLRFSVPPLAHAALEPPTATVRIGSDTVDVWAPTQAQTFAREEVAAALGRPVAQVQIHATEIGGSFGRKLYADFIRQAALAAQAVGKPVKLTWSRAEDLANDHYRPPAATTIDIGYDPSGAPVSWRQRLAVPDLRTALEIKSAAPSDVDIYAVEGAAPFPYAIAHHELSWHDTRLPLRMGWWRSVGHSFNAWFMEHALDAFAHHVGRDPLQLRLSLLPEGSRHRKVFQALAPLLREPATAGRFRGFAVHESYGSLVALAAEISVEAKGLRVHRLACAVDCGTVLDPDGVRAQIEGGLIFGLTATLHGEVTLRGGQVQQDSFDAYQLMTLREAPQIDLVLMDSTEPPAGVGEIAVPPVAPAVCNALLAATGQVTTRLPVRRA